MDNQELYESLRQVIFDTSALLFIMMCVLTAITILSIKIK